MKTLDEVINALEICSTHLIRCDRVCPYYKSGCIEYEMEKDALHYLREYRAEKANLEITKGNYQDAIENCDKAENKFKIALKKLDIGTLNDPLTWEDLKEKTGKPVWIESHGDITQYTGWAIVKDIRPDDRVNFILSRYEDDGFYALEIGVLKASMGVEWQAYRKERS